MTKYRILYLHNGEHDDLDADSDDEALTLFSLRKENVDCEIWYGNRKVASIACGSYPVPASLHPSPNISSSTRFTSAYTRSA